MGQRQCLMEILHRSKLIQLMDNSGLLGKGVRSQEDRYENYSKVPTPYFMALQRSSLQVKRSCQKSYSAYVSTTIWRRACYYHHKLVNKKDPRRKWRGSFIWYILTNFHFACITTFFLKLA